jgi:excisionase family DNA binding protein
MTQPLLSLQQAADALAISEQTAKALVKQGALQAINVGVANKQQLRIAKDALEKFIESRTINRGG